MTEFQAAILSAQLARLTEQSQQRLANGLYLNGRLRRDPGLRPLAVPPYATRHAFHIYALRFDEALFGLDRATFLAAMAAEGIPCSSGYASPLYRNPMFAEMQYRRCLPGLRARLLGGGLVRTPPAAGNTAGYGRYRPRGNSDLRVPQSTHSHATKISEGVFLVKQFRNVIRSDVAGACPATVMAQEFRASISGGVTDPTGAAVEGARVVALSLERNVPYETTTNAAGRYMIQYLLPGKYSVTVDKDGFKKFVRNGIDAVVGGQAGRRRRPDLGHADREHQRHRRRRRPANRDRDASGGRSRTGFSRMCRREAAICSRCNTTSPAS